MEQDREYKRKYCLLYTSGVIHNEMDAKSALSTEQHVKVAQEVIRKSTEENGKKRGNFSSFNLSQKWDVNPYASLRFQTKLALIFTEALYRACTIIKGEPYHHE